MPHVDERVIADFQRRRKRMIHSVGFSLVLFILGLVLRQIADLHSGLFGVGQQGWNVFAIAQIIAAVVLAMLGVLQYRCPVCREIVRAHDLYYFGVAMDPEICPNCRARLKE